MTKQNYQHFSVTNEITALTPPDKRGQQTFSEKDPRVSILGFVGQEEN